MQRLMSSRLASALRPLLAPSSLMGRTVGPIALVTAALLGLVLPIHWWAERGERIDDASTLAAAVANGVALGLDGEKHEQWADKLEAGRPVTNWNRTTAELELLRDRMVEVAGSTQTPLVLTTLRVRKPARDPLLAAPDQERKGALERMLSTANDTVWRESVDYQPEMELALLQGQGAGSGLQQGSRGRAILGWAPITDGFGATTGLVQVEVPMDAALAAVFRAHTFFAALAASASLIGLGLGLRRARRTRFALQDLGATARSTDVDEPYLADDPTAETLELVQALEERRASETAARTRLTLDAAKARQSARQAASDLAGHERLRQRIAAAYPTALRRLAGAVGRIDASALDPTDRGALRDAVLKTCELARALDQHREVAELRAGERSLKQERVALVELVESALEGPRKRASERSVDLRVVIGASIPQEIEADSEILQRALSGLTENAVQAVAAAGGGSVSLRVKRLEGTSDTDVRFELCDSAPGLTESEADGLFEPFPLPGEQHRRRENPLDASLAVVAELLRLHGADLGVESAPGSGTRVAFTIPFRREEAHATPPAALPGTGAARLEDPLGEHADGTVEFELGVMHTAGE